LFAAGAIHALATMAAWFAWVEGVRRGLAPALAWTVSPGWAHAHALVWGAFSFYAVGFLGTAFPRWTDGRPPALRRVIAWVGLLLAAQALLGLGLVNDRAYLLGSGLCTAGAFASLVHYLGAELRRSRTPRRLQPACVVAAVALGLAGGVLDCLGLAERSLALHRAGLALGVHGYLLLLAVGVAQRVIPMFSARAAGRSYAPRPSAILGVVLGLVAARLVATLVQGPFPAESVVGGADAALGAVLVWEARTWRPGRAWRNPMLGVLFLAGAWIVAALWASAASAALPARAPALRLPVLHALTVGGFATLLLGVSSRVTLGHAGRPIVAGATLVAAFAGIQLSALLRVTLALAPQAADLAHWAAVPWCLAFALWLARLGPLLVRGDRAGSGPDRDHSPGDRTQGS
jgi:uncharacterized protein involved in response to NO